MRIFATSSLVLGTLGLLMSSVLGAKIKVPVVQEMEKLDFEDADKLLPNMVKIIGPHVVNIKDNELYTVSNSMEIPKSKLEALSKQIQEIIKSYDREYNAIFERYDTGLSDWVRQTDGPLLENARKTNAELVEAVKDAVKDYGIEVMDESGENPGEGSKQKETED